MSAFMVLNTKETVEKHCALFGKVISYRVRSQQS